MREYGFSLNRILPYKDRIVESVFIRKNMVQWKTLLSQILYNESFTNICSFFPFFNHHYQTVLGNTVPSDSKIFVSEKLFQNNLKFDYKDIFRNLWGLKKNIFTLTILLLHILAFFKNTGVIFVNFSYSEKLELKSTQNKIWNALHILFLVVIQFL